LDEESLADALLTLLFEYYPQVLDDRYEIKDQSAGLLEAVAIKRGILASGGIPDTERAAPLVLSDFRNGKLGRFTLELPGDE
jgi:ribosome biogenesis GTPase A